MVAGHLDTFTGLLLSTLTRNSASHHVLLNWVCAHPLWSTRHIDSDQSMHFTSQAAQSWTLEHGVLWNFFSAKVPRGLTYREKMAYSMTCSQASRQ